MLNDSSSRRQNGNYPSYDEESYKYNQIWTNKQFHHHFSIPVSQMQSKIIQQDDIDDLRRRKILK